MLSENGDRRCAIGWDTKSAAVIARGVSHGTGGPGVFSSCHHRMLTVTAGGTAMPVADRPKSSRSS